MEIRAPHTPAEWTAYCELRYAVLRQPWGQPLGSELADDDSAATTRHAAAFAADGTMLGVGRLHPNGPGQGQLRYMAVATGQQGQGIGSEMLRYLEAAALAISLNEIVLHARETAVPFYQRHGYSVVAASHTLFGVIPHFLMRKNLLANR